MEILVEQTQIQRGDLAVNSYNKIQNLTITEKWNAETFVSGGNRTTFLESVLATVFTDGLSRTGSVSAFSNTDLALGQWSLWSYDPVPGFSSTLLQGGSALKPPTSDQDFTMSRVNVTIEGYTYYASASTDFLAIVVVLFHCLVALAHTLYCLLVRR